MTKLSDYLTKVQSNEERDRLAKVMGDNHAQPIIRSMYPARSRGEMSREFQQLYSLGYDSRTADINRLCEIVKLLADDRRRLYQALSADDFSELGFLSITTSDQINHLIEGIEK